MKLLDQHKALLITLLISGTLVLAMFSFHITKESEFISESYYEVEPQTIEELKALEEKLKAEEAAKATTNEAFNEDQEFKEMMKNFRSMASNDFEKTTQEEENISEESSESPFDEITSKSNYNNSKAYAINEKERESFNKAKDVLTSQSKNKTKDDTNTNRSSSVSFSLKNRSKVKLPPPVYLCEVNGKIVVNITVDSNGLVTDTYINSVSSSSNQCLIDHALEYAQNAIFSTANTKSQIGSITYYFKGKN